MKPVRVGTRASALARWQTDFITAALRALDPELTIEIVELSTAGDEFPEALLADFEGTGFFTSALERALLAGEIDAAVHSYKDLPVESHSALAIAAVPRRGPIEDVWCAKGHAALDALPRAARVGTSSARRTAQLRALRADLDFVSLRGNVPTRVRRVTEGELSAIVLARAGLTRLGLDAHITRVFTPAEMLPAPAQGALAVQTRVADRALFARLAALDDPETRAAVETERGLLHALGGGCAVPVGALATVSGGEIELEAGVFDPDGMHPVRSRARGREPGTAARQAANDLVGRGAGEILAQFSRALRPESEVT